MRHRTLGQTGLELSELSLGTWGLSGEAYGAVDEAEQDRVIDRAHALGIDTFETADSYANGTMERKLGERLPDDGTVKIITKLGTDRDASPPRKRFDETFLREAFARSRERLDREVVDIVLLHNPAEATVAEGDAPAVLESLREEGAIRAWGVSAGSVEVARAALKRGAGVLSLAYNVFFTEDLHELEGEITASGVGVLARSVLAHGLLCGYWSMHKEFAPGDHRTERWTPDELRRRVHQTQAMRALIGGMVYTMRAGALRYALHNEQITSAILGPRNSVQLDQLVRESGRQPPYLSEEKLEKLRNRLRDVGVSP